MVETLPTGDVIENPVQTFAVCATGCSAQVVIAGWVIECSRLQISWSGANVDPASFIKSGTSSVCLQPDGASSHCHCRCLLANAKRAIHASIRVQ